MLFDIQTTEPQVTYIFYDRLRKAQVLKGSKHIVTYLTNYLSLLAWLYTFSVSCISVKQLETRRWRLKLWSASRNNNLSGEPAHCTTTTIVLGISQWFASHTIDEIQLSCTALHCIYHVVDITYPCFEININVQHSLTLSVLITNFLVDITCDYIPLILKYFNAVYKIVDYFYYRYKFQLLSNCVINKTCPLYQ